MSNPFNNYKKFVMQQSLHITAKYTTPLAETFLFILGTLYQLSILFQCHLFIYLLILYIDFHTIESNMNHVYQNMKNRNLGEISDHLDTPLECHSRHAQFTEGTDKFIQKSESHINSDHSLASHGSVPNASKLSILGKGNKVSH